ncbi:DoxX family protein [Acuticoccus sp. M5D2P5]|uniref:DoxX family protein n=1 Tax=Acuticoccus kalidii TaxID=2910977 RepID=UPI001F482D8D|nr:DoxX family protein [Acuticoccus kalidii]MCF3935800.1 DoxX family protein [Acuticoccus kalidii]
MLIILRTHDFVFRLFDRIFGRWVLGTLGRLIFAGVLLVYFLESALTKLGSGLRGLFELSPAAYAQILPKQMEAVGYDPTQLPLNDQILVYVGTYAEIILPILIVIGFLTRIASVGMIVFLAVMTYVDINGHDVASSTIGAWFNGETASPITDIRTLWGFLLLTLVFTGPGPFSLDYFWGRRIRRLRLPR